MTTKSRRKPLSPQSILNRYELLNQLQNNNIKISPIQLDTFYHLLHTQNYPPLPQFTQWYNTNTTKVKKQLPKPFLQYLNQTQVFQTITSSIHSTHAKSDTIKLVLKLQDGHFIECVSMYYTNSRYTLCVSSQVGCAMKCTFCATGTMGIKGNVTSGEIVEQMIHMTRTLNEDTTQPKSIRNIVFMGMGEPLNNYKNVIESIHLLKNTRTWSLRNDRITISTVGITNKILQLCTDLPNVNLALSLHAPNQKLREEIVPTATRYPLEELIQAFLTFAGSKEGYSGRKRKRRKGMIEYVLIGNSPTSTIQSAHELGQLLVNTNPNDTNDIVVNLIPYNPTQSSSNEFLHTRPDREHIMDFQGIVESYGIPCYVRRTFGDDIDSACGQLVVDIEDIHEEKKIDSVVSNTGVKSKKKNDMLKYDKKPMKINTSPRQENTDSDIDKSPNANIKLKWLVKPLTYATIIAATCCIVSTGILLLTNTSNNTGKKNDSVSTST